MTGSRHLHVLVEHLEGATRRRVWQFHGTLPALSRAMTSLARSVSILALLLVALPVSGQREAVPLVLEGSYAYTHDLDHARAVIAASIEPHLTEVPGPLRDLVRDHARDARVPSRIRIALGTRDVHVIYAGPDGEVIVGGSFPGTTRITTRDGSEVPVRQHLRAGWLEQVFVGPRGELSVVLSCEPDGRVLHLDYTVRGERLRAPVLGRLDYHRAE